MWSPRSSNVMRSSNFLTLSDNDMNEDAMYNNDEEGRDDGNDVNNNNNNNRVTMLFDFDSRLSSDPQNTALLLRHRSPSICSNSIAAPNAAAASAAAHSYANIHRHRRALDRLRIDSTANTRHALFQNSNHNNNSNDNNNNTATTTTTTTTTPAMEQPEHHATGSNNGSTAPPTITTNAVSPDHGMTTQDHDTDDHNGNNGVSSSTTTTNPTFFQRWNCFSSSNSSKKSDGPGGRLRLPPKDIIWNTIWNSIIPCPSCRGGDTNNGGGGSSRHRLQYSLRHTLQKDVIAGFTVAIMAIPLSMSYAKLAGLPPHYGLYATFVPSLVYPWFGTTRQLAVGPAALVSLLVSSGITPIVQAEVDAMNFQDPEAAAAFHLERYVTLAIQCSFLAGLINIVMGILRLGFVTQFLSRALISGFTSGAAIIIALSQVKHLLGYRSVPSAKGIYQTLSILISNLGPNFNWRTFVFGTTCIVVLVVAKYTSTHPVWTERYPSIKWVRATSSILVSVVAIAITYGFQLDQHGILIVGNIPPGLPSITIQLWFPLNSQLWVVVISMVIVGFIQSIAISKRFAYKHGFEIDPSQELISLGLANMLGGMFSSYPVTGAMGQSAVNDDIGAETGVSSIVTGFVVGLVLLFATPVFEFMPLTVLAAIVISFVLGMLDYPEAIYLFQVHKFDFSVWMVAFLGTMFLGVEYGLAIAVAVSILIVIYESVYPHTAVLGRLPGTSMYRNIKQYPTAERYDGLVIIRIDTPLYFANAGNVRDKIRKYKRVAAADLEERNAGQVRYIIFDFSPVSHIDTTALHVLEDMYITQKRLGVQLCCCNPGITVTELLLKSGLVDLIGRQYFFPAVIDAVEWCLLEMDNAAAVAHGDTSMLGDDHDHDDYVVGADDDDNDADSASGPLEPDLEEPCA